MFGFAWFCKEAAIFVVPLLIYLYAIKPAFRKITINAFWVYIFLGLIYWLLRSRIIPLGAAADIHPLSVSRLFAAIPASVIRLSLPSLTVLPAVVGLMVTLLLAFSARSALFFGYVFTIVLCAAMIYQDTISFGVIGYQLPLINSAIFDARLFYIPLALLMFGLLLQRQTWPFVLLIVSFMAATPIEFLHYKRFQLAYQAYYQLAMQRPQGLVIYADKTSGVQGFSGLYGLKIGEYPQADYVINPKDGSLTPIR